MAMRRKRNEQNGVKDGSWGYSEKSLAELESGQYGRTTNRKARYNTSSEQTRQAHELPALEGMASKAIWESNYGKNRKSPNTVDSRSARRKYEQRIGHYADDARNLRNQGYSSSYTNVDFSGLSDLEKEALDAALMRREDEKKTNDNLRSFEPGSAGAKVFQWIKDTALTSPSDEDRIAEAQNYIDAFGHSKEDVLNAYQIYKASKEREARETTPFKAGFKDFRSAPDRGLANAVKYLGQNFFPDSDIEKAGDWLREHTGANEVEKQRNYSRESTKIGDVKKALLDPYFQYGDLASSELAAALLSGGAMADPATGFGMMFEGNPLLKGAMRYGSGYGLTADEKYNQLVKQGVDEEEASKLANVSGLSMAAAQAAGKLIPSLGATAPLAQRLLTNGGINATIMAGRQGLEEIADTIIRENQSSYNQSVQKHIAEGMTPEQADRTAKMEIYSRLGGAGLFGFLMGTGSELASNGLSKAASKAADSVDDTLNSVWATQEALPQNDIPLLTGSVDNPHALTGSAYNVPALVDNIYPIQMPGTQGVIPMPGTNGVIAPVVGGDSAPVANKVANEWLSWQNPRLVKKLEGAELESAKAQVESNGRQIEAIQRQIKGITENKSNYYRGNLKKAVQADVRKLEGQIKELEKSTKDLKLQMKGGLKPVLDMLTKEQKDLIYDTSGKHDSVFSQINFAVKFAGDTPEAKALAKRAQDAIREYVRTGSRESSREIVAALTELDNMAKSVNAVYKSSKGNEWTYEQAFGDQAKYLYHFQPVYDIYNAEKLAAKAAREAAQSAPVEAPVEVNPEDVIYHAGILSRLNKADSAGKMEGTRDTGYFGTGHYFVDQAHKASIGKGSGYGDKPYTSVDISKYDNLFKADTDSKASQLHDFSQKMMRYVNKRNDKYYTENGEIVPESLEEYMDKLYKSYASLFGDKAMSRADFEARLNRFRDDYEYDFYDRGDSAFTTFMKEHGYNGVDTRGTNSANTERGVVIYDLDEDSVLQSNVTDETTKSGLMNTRVRNGQPIFDEETDARIQKEIDTFNRRKEIRQEYKRLYDESKLNSLKKEVENLEKDISDRETDSIGYYQAILKDDEYVRKEAERLNREFEQFGLPGEDIEKIIADKRASARESIAEITEQINRDKARLSKLRAQLDAEEKLSDAAYKQAKANIEGTTAPIKQTNEPSVKTRTVPKDTITEGEGPSVNNVPQPAQNVNAVPEVTNEPNFTTVGEPYTPQEVPNVQPTPPTTPPPTEEVPNMGGTEKTSQYYKNTMRGTETNRDMSDEEYANRFNEEIYKRMTIPEQQSVSQGQKFIEESGGNEAAIQRLLSGDFDSEERFSGYHIDAAQMLANDIERQALELEANGQDASQLWRTANKLHKKIQLNASDFGVGLQALQKWKRATPQGAYDDLVTQINKGIDKKKTTGYTRKVNDLSDKIVDAVENTEDKSSLIQKIKDIFAKDRENNPYNTQKAEQLVLDLVGGDKNTKMSITDLADEAGRLIKKEMGTSTLTPKEERAILNLLDAASKLDPGTREYNVLVSRAMTIVDDSLPSSFGEKFKSLLYDNMLASIKTMFTRNLGGNVVGNTIDFMAAPFQVGADALVGKFTGERTRVLTGKSIVEAAKGLGHGFKDWGQDIGYSLKNKTLLNTARSGQESLADVLHAVHKTWKTQSNNKAVKGIHNALATYDYIIRKGMEGGDRPIYEAQYAATQAELYHLVKKYGDAGLRKGLPADKRDVDTDDLIDMIAINEALEAVLQNDSKMKEAAKDIKSFFKKASEDMVGIDVASMSHAPFVEVPANMASNFFKLTPVGWVGNINRTIGEKRKYGSINQRRFTGELGLNVLGGLMGAGLFAVANKIISDKYSEDKDEKKLQQNNGYQEYALQAPDESWQADISDIPYLGAMMKFAKMERDAYNEDGAKGALSALPSAIGAATVDTLYQSLNRLTGADFQYNGSGNLVGNAINNIKSSVGSMGVPSWLRQTAQFTDPYKRDLGDYGSDEYNKNLIINGIPGLRQTMLDPKIDTAGQPVPELGGATGLNRFMSAYINPWKISHPHKNTSAVQEYANMLKQATEGKVNPQMKVVNKSDITKIKGYDAENYSHKDLRDFQEEYYKSNTEYGNALINDPWFTNLSYEKQGELLDELWKANKALCQENFVRKGKTPEEIEAAGDELYTTDNKLAGILRDDDENHTGLIQWLKDETARDEMNEKYGTNMSHDKYVDFNSRGDGYAEQRASEADKAKALGMTVDNYEKYEAEYPGGAQARYDDANAAREYGFVNTDKTVNLDAYNIARDLGDGDPTVMQAYADYKQQGIKSNAYSAKADYLFDDDRLTDEQKGMIIAGSQDGSKLGNVASGARGMYEAGGNDYAGIYYYYLLKNMADTDGSGRISKDERKAFFENDNPYLDELWQLSQDMYTYLQGNLK